MTMAFDKPVDAEARTGAESDLERNWIVVAGAGTGKTTLLIRRLLGLIVGKGIPVERVVALTFTKKAAEEMRVRLEEALRKVADPAGDFSASAWAVDAETLRERASTAIEDIPKAQITTIHSFAGFLLRLYPVQAGVDPRFREDEGEIFARVFDEEWRAWLAAELGEDAPRSALWRDVLMEIPLDDLAAVAERLASPMVDLEALRTPFDTRALAQAGLARWNAFLACPPRRMGPSFAPWFDAVGGVFGALAQGEPVPTSAVSALETDRSSSPPKDWEDRKADLSDLYRLARGFSRVDDARCARVIELLSPFVLRLRRELSRRGAVSFDGLLVFARDLLRDHAEVREELKRRFETFLVDEFQDTDPLQGEILFYLAETAGNRAVRWQDVRLAPGKLFVVGDPKQSIYRFRGADIAAFELFQKSMVDQGAAVATLQANFRSHEAVLSPVNAVFPSVMRESPLLQPAYVPLLPGMKSDRRAGAEVWVLAAGENGGDKADAFKRREAEAIASWIKENVGKTVGGGPLNYRDCALLFRSASHFEFYLDAFRRAAIPYLAEGEKFFYQTPEVTEFLNVVASAADPADRLAFVGVLRSPLGALDDAEILALARAGGLDYRRPPKIFADRLRPLFAELRRLHAVARREPVGRLIGDLLRTSFIVPLTARRRFGEQALANLFKIRSLAEAWSAEQPLTARAFVRRFNTYREDQKQEGENPLADVRYNAVKVMTIHKAKGLEFPVVFLPNLCSARSGGSDDRVIEQDWRSGAVGLRLPKAGFINGAMVAVESEIRRREKAELVRVFYVAATRAKERLFLIVRDGPLKEESFAAYLDRAGCWPGEAGESIRMGAEDVPVVRVPYAPIATDGSPAAVQPLPDHWEPGVLAAAHGDRLTSWLAYRDAAPRAVSPTWLMRREESRPLRKKKTAPAAAHDEIEKWRDRDEPDGAVGSAPAVQVGLLCHAALEIWDFSTPRPLLEAKLKKEFPRAVRMVASRPGEADLSEAVQVEAAGILRTFFAGGAYDRIVRARIVGREIPFFYPLAPADAVSPRVMRGLIDLLYELDGTLVIADYKTNRLEPGSAAAAAESYRTQGDVYRRAIREAAGREAAFELIFLRTGERVRLD